MAKYMVVKDGEGNVEAHGLNYTLKDGEQQVGEVEADSVEAATKKAKRQGLGSEDEEGDDEQEGLVSASREPSEEQIAKENEQLRKDEEAKQEFTVMSDGKGNFYVEGDKESDPKKQKGSKAKALPPEEPEPAEVGTFRAKDAAEAIKRAKGEFRDPAEGAARGAQTP